MNLLLLLALLLGPPAPVAPIIRLEGYFSCQGGLLTPQGNAAFACYARTQHDCQNGTVILAYERRVSTPAEKTRFAIVDTVRLKIHYPTNSLSIGSCTDATGKLRKYFVLCGQDNLGEKYLRHVLRVWGVDAQGHLVELPIKKLNCLNDDFGA